MVRYTLFKSKQDNICTEVITLLIILGVKSLLDS
jgi:hypothetical protein